MEKTMVKNVAPKGDEADLDSLMDELSVSDRRLEMAGGSGRPSDQPTAAPGVGCTYDCN
jgi:hypothetical protein